MMLQKPLKCRNANCGAMCSPANAEMWSDNPEKCPNYKRDNHVVEPSKIKRMQELLDESYAKGFADGKEEGLRAKPQGYWIEDATTYYQAINKNGCGVDEYTPYFTDDIACSVCLAKYNTIDNETQFFKFCPNCGAKMGMDKGKWIPRKNISVKPKDIDKVSNLRWRYECSECGFEVKEKSNECPKCHKQMSEN